MTIEEAQSKLNEIEFINKQLNEQLIQKADTNHQLVERMADLEARNAELEETLGKCAKMPVLYCLGAKETITKARELLNEFMRISKASDEDFEHDYSELIGEATQFIKGE